WFKIINIAGEKLTDQELRNAIYTGEWLTDAKRYFSKSNCPAYNIAKDYLTGVAIRQEYLETAIKWISGDNIEQYMADNQHSPNANELWLYFQGIINWVKVLFTNYRKEMKGINWGDLYNRFKDKKFDAKKLEEQIKQLILDDDVTSKKGIYEYLIDGQEKHLSIRSFTDKNKLETYEKQKALCKKCGKEYKFEEMEADHIKPWSKGGKTTVENCQMLCKDCNRRKSNV
ncbi:MAG: HNH endonuclease, partial [Fibromonadaceae bacterium]|nr:HNH endonuclease [Fibromonadaceae bacterium]